ncbi:MAG TPA: endonuclease MutS2 [Lapidilactobacillus dextrinicus]|uniref:Endonuclease MutS2 n=1 Tax=Lapidilactobacillus dextrinicus TaxID=51664 RepID=A0A921DW65_9LACO|nr:endonuclease MutS2 [Lapidilactobacillus dextrinicus]
MNTKVLTTLEFNKIKQKLQPYLRTDMGQELAQALVPVAKRDQVQQRLDETKDGADLLRVKGGLPIAQLQSVAPSLKRLDIGGNLNGPELAAISRNLQATSSVLRFFRDLDLPFQLRALPHLIEQLVGLPEQTQMLRRSIDSDGTVLDEASTKLAAIRKTIHSTETQIRSKMDEYTHGSNAKYLTEPIVTIRDERYVVPVRSEYKHQFGGIIHDQSASGQTFYVEPQSVLNLNNKLRQDQLAEKQEIERIFAELSVMLAPYTNELRHNQTVMGQLDFINAKAHYAAEIKATEPIINANNEVALRQARHPLIDQKKVVSNDIAIGKDYQAIVVTGPNTGGKTITLKTLGLIQLMAQAGLFIPAAEESQIGIFREVFADIGDEQSIEQNLSTFSAHMDNIIQILDQVNDQDLVLFDELGAGTDPQEGASLAIAILDYLGGVGAYVVASTHYPELKLYGYERPGTINASMEFDVESLQPTYRLLIGVPGRSNAFDISKRLGMPEAIVAAAQALMNDASQDLNNMISDLEQQRKQTEAAGIELQQQLADATELHQELSHAWADFNAQRDQLMSKAEDKADELVNDAQKQADEVIDELRQMRLTGRTDVKENQLIEAKGKLNKLHPERQLAHNRVLQRAKKKQELSVGDDVKVLSYGQTGVITQKFNDKQFEVQVGIIKMKLPARDLEKIKPEKTAPQRHIVTVRGSNSHVATQLDLRGQRYEEALANLDQYIDSALLAGYETVTIVHGKGTGAIRQGVQDYLKRNRRVKKYEYAPASAGGNGATLVYFK